MLNTNHSEHFYQDLLRYLGDNPKHAKAKIMSLHQTTRYVTDILTTNRKTDPETAIKEKSNVLHRCARGDQYARDQVNEMVKKILIDECIEVPGMTTQQVVEAIYAYNWGFDVLQKYYDDPKTEELYGNRHDQNYRVVNNRRQKINVSFRDQIRLTNLIERWTSGNKAGPAGVTNCLVSTDLLDGTRVTARMPPVSRWPSYNLRKLNNFPIELAAFVENNTFSEDVAIILEVLARMYANIIILGGTKVGKTTLLKLLLKMTPATDRLILMERNREIKLADILPERDILELQEYLAMGYTLENILTSVLQASPDRMIACECLGPEELFILSMASSRGHEGNMATYHLNLLERLVDSLAQVYSRKEQQQWQHLRPLIARDLNIAIHLDSTHLYARKIVGIAEVDYDYKNNVTTYNYLVRYDKIADKYYFSLPKSEEMQKKLLRLGQQDSFGSSLYEKWEKLAKSSEQVVA